MHDLEVGYTGLSHKLAVDREALIMMCHQYAYADKIPKECEAIIGGLAGPIDFAWNWPDKPCHGHYDLPPFPHPEAQYNLPEPYTPDYVPEPIYPDQSEGYGHY